MKFRKSMCVVFAALAMMVAADAFGQALSVGNGYSVLKDAAEAGAEAAAMAKKALDGDAKVVLVFDGVTAKPEAKNEMLQGIASVFDSSLIYGCSAYAPITQDCNTGTVGVLAIGGDVTVNAAVSGLEGGHEACGTRIGDALRAAGKSDASGQLVVLVGSCHVNKNDALVKGVDAVLDDKVKIAGGAASAGEFLYAKGKLVEEKSNLGLMLCGNFTCSFSAGDGKGLEGVISSARDACNNALGDAKDKAIAVLAFDCGGRRGSLGGDVPRELAAMKEAIGDLPLFGFYGSGETGPKDNDSPPRGVGYHVIICAILGE